FPDASTRGLRNRIVREWERRDDPPPYKVVSDSELPVIGRARFYGQEFPMNRFCGFPPTPEFTGDLEEMSLLAGESAGQTKRLMSAASIIDEMISGAEAVTKPFTDYTAEDFKRLVSTNLDGFIYITQLAIKQMLAQKSGGSIVSITASLADNPIAGVNAS